MLKTFAFTVSISWNSMWHDKTRRHCLSVRMVRIKCDGWGFKGDRWQTNYRQHVWGNQLTLNNLMCKCSNFGNQRWNMNQLGPAVKPWKKPLVIHTPLFHFIFDVKSFQSLGRAHRGWRYVCLLKASRRLWFSESRQIGFHEICANTLASPENRGQNYSLYLFFVVSLHALSMFWNM